MRYLTASRAADLVFGLHVLFVLLAVAGALGLLWSPWWLLFHLPIVGWSAVINLRGGTCPLTPLESNLRGAAANPGLDDGFLAHYIGPRVWPGATPRQLERAVGVFIVAWNGLLYLILWWWLAR